MICFPASFCVCLKFVPLTVELQLAPLPKMPSSWALTLSGILLDCKTTTLNAIYPTFVSFSVIVFYYVACSRIQDDYHYILI